MRRGWVRSVGAVLGTAALVLGAPAGAARAADPFGALAQPDPGACVHDQAAGGGCDAGLSLGGATAVAVSPDGLNAYAASPDSGAVAVFARDPDSGRLGQLAPSAACVADVNRTDQNPGCSTGAALGSPDAVVADYDQVYVASGSASAQNGNGLAVFERDGATGALTQLPGPTGCFLESSPDGTCKQLPDLDASSLALSPDGRFLYLTSATDDAVTWFARDPGTGGLTYAGCVSEGGTGSCRDGRALQEASGIAFDPANDRAYVSAALGGVAIFGFDPDTGALTQLAGAQGCVTPNGEDDYHAGFPPCGTGRGLVGAQGVAVSPDGAVYVASSRSSSLALFHFSDAAGTLVQAAGTGGCASVDGSQSTGGPTTCSVAPGLGGADAVAVGDDRETLYATGSDGNVSSFAIAADDTLAPTGCLSSTGTPGCTSGTALGGATGLALSPDGESAYVAAQGDSAVAELGRAGAAHPTFAFTPAAVQTGQQVSFDGSASTGSQGSAIDNGAWDFADGGGAAGATATHTFTTAGIYDVALTIEDANGRAATTVRRVTVTDPPTDGGSNDGSGSGPGSGGDQSGSGSDSGSGQSGSGSDSGSGQPTPPTPIQPLPPSPPPSEYHATPIAGVYAQTIPVYTSHTIEAFHARTVTSYHAPTVAHVKPAKVARHLPRHPTLYNAVSHGMSAPVSCWLLCTTTLDATLEMTNQVMQDAGAARAKRITIAKGKGTLPSAGTGSLKAPLTRLGRKLLKRLHHPVKVRITTIVADGAVLGGSPQAPTVRTQTIRLRPPHARKKHHHHRRH